MIQYLKDFAAMLIVSIIIVVVVLWLAPRAHAANTGTLVLQGTVPAINELTVTASNNLALNIVNGENNKLVGTVTELSNDPDGYKIYASSANAGKLQMNGSTVNYTMNYDGNSVTLTGSLQQLKNVNSLSGLVTDTSQVKITIPASPNKPQGLYTDTITFSMVAN